ncbi:MAG: class I SAM-dependent methyltransferase [Crocosphaera sp.]
MNPEYEIVAQQYQKLQNLPLVLYVDSYSYLKIIGDLTGKKVLDLGCGDGLYTRKFKEKGAKKVVGVDISEAMITLAKEAENKAPLGIEYLQKDVTSLGKLDQFDIVTASYLLNHAASGEELLLMCQTIAKNLKQGGRFVGLNNNIFRDASIYDKSEKYGVLNSIEGDLKEGSLIKVTFKVPNSNETFSVNDYYLSQDTYELAFREAGLKNLQFSYPEVSEEGIKDLGEEFWEDMLNYPPIIIIQAMR